MADPSIESVGGWEQGWWYLLVLSDAVLGREVEPESVGVALACFLGGAHPAFPTPGQNSRPRTGFYSELCYSGLTRAPQTLIQAEGLRTRSRRGWR